MKYNPWKYIGKFQRRTSKLFYVIFGHKIYHLGKVDRTYITIEHQCDWSALNMKEMKLFLKSKKPTNLWDQEYRLGGIEEASTFVAHDSRGLGTNMNVQSGSLNQHLLRKQDNPNSALFINIRGDPCDQLERYTR